MQTWQQKIIKTSYIVLGIGSLLFVLYGTATNIVTTTPKLFGDTLNYFLYEFDINNLALHLGWGILLLPFLGLAIILPAFIVGLLSSLFEYFKSKLKL